MTNKKIFLVTGGAGFIGSHLCERLVKDSSHVVYSLDNYFTGTEANHVSDVRYIKGDTRNIARLINFSPDVIFHLGEYSRVEQSFDDMETVWAANKEGTFAVLEFALKSASKLVYAGSSTKFGDGGLAREATPYAWTKATNTELVINYGKWYGLTYAITYFYNVYGPREIESGKYATLIALFRRKMINNEPLTVVSPGTQERNFTHIDDVVNALVLVGEYGVGDEYGIGCDDSYSINSIAEMFGGEIQMISERKGNRMSAAVISEKTKQLGWSAKVNIVDYIKEVSRENQR